jgi:hypothetical protein
MEIRVRELLIERQLTARNRRMPAIMDCAHACASARSALHESRLIPNSQLLANDRLAVAGGAGGQSKVYFAGL